MKTKLVIKPHMGDEDKAIFKPCIDKLDDFMQHPHTWQQEGVWADALDHWLRFKNLVLSGNENIAGRH